jgi:hypothetical protein
MKKLLPILGLVMLCTYLNAQNSALPQPVYATMVKACTSADITMLQGGAGSISVEGENIAMLQDFITEIAIDKPSTTPTANIMCLIQGSEFVSGTVYLGKVNGAVVFNVGGVEYTNALNSKGVEFFRSVVAM